MLLAELGVFRAPVAVLSLLLVFPVDLSQLVDLSLDFALLP